MDSEFSYELYLNDKTNIMKSGKVLFFSEDNILYFKKQNIQDLYFSVPLKKIENFSEILEV